MQQISLTKPLSLTTGCHIPRSTPTHLSRSESRQYEFQSQQRGPPYPTSPLLPSMMDMLLSGVLKVVYDIDLRMNITVLFHPTSTWLQCQCVSYSQLDV